MKLLLIDSRINERQIFIDSRRDDVIYKVFDYIHDTYESLLSCEELGQGQFTDIALVQHTDMILGIKMLEQEPRCDSYDSAPYSSFDRLRSFFKDLKDKHGLQRFDFLGCSMYDAQVMPQIFSALEGELGIDLRASTNFTGNAPDGDWILESDNVNVRDKYFTEAIQEWKGTLGGIYYRNYGNKSGISGDIVGATPKSLTVVSNDYVEEAYFYGNVGITMPGSIPDNLKGVKVRDLILSTQQTVIIDTSGRVWTWGPNEAAYTPTGLSGVIFASIHVLPGSGFGAISDISRTLYTWGGSPQYGGAWGNNTGGIPATLVNVRVKKIVAKSNSFITVVLSESNQVYYLGGNAWNSGLIPTNLSGVQISDAYITLNACAVVDMSGRLYSWGATNMGGISSTFRTALTPSGFENLQITAVAANEYAFAAIDNNKRVWSWGDIASGATGATTTTIGTPSGLVGIPISSIYGFSANGFYAIAEGTKQLYVWGSSTYTGNSTNTAIIPSGLENVPVSSIVKNKNAIACISETDNILRVFGSTGAGGGGSGIAAVPKGLENIAVKEVIASQNLFTAITLISGDIYTWGQDVATYSYGTDSRTAVKIQGLTYPKSVVGVDSGFIAISNIDNKVYTWGRGTASNSTTTAQILYTVADKEFDILYSNYDLPISYFTYAMIDKNTREVYSGSINVKNTQVPILRGKKVIKVVSNLYAVTVLTNETSGNVYTFGSMWNWANTVYINYGSVPIVPTNLQNRKIEKIYSTDEGFAAIDASKNIWTWGNGGAATAYTWNGLVQGNYTIAAIPSGLQGIPMIDVYTSSNRFYAISDISKNVYNIYNNTASIPPGLAGISAKSILLSQSSYAVISENNRVYTIGDTNNGGAGINSNTAGIPSGLENIEIDKIVATQIAYAVIDISKRLWCWGGYGGGGVNANTKLAVTPSGLENITFKSVVANTRSFAAISETGTVYAWGMTDRGGVGADAYTAATPVGLDGIPVSKLFVADYAIAAITDISKNVYTWGSQNNGGAGVTTKAAGIPNGLQGIPVNDIISNEYSFAAITDISNRVYAWGHVGSGGVGTTNSSAAIPIGLENISISGLISNQHNYHAITSNGDIYTWGNTGNFMSRASARHAGLESTLSGRGINFVEGSTPLLVPTAPRNAAVVAGSTEATITYSAPLYTGNSPILYYEVNVNNGETILTSETVAPVTVSGLTNGVTYTATVKAVNAVGSSAASSTLNFIPGTALPPTTVTSVSTDGQLTVSFTASPNDNGFAVSYYIMTVSGQDVSGLTSPLALSGLVNGQSYNITVKAVNEHGIGGPSVPIVAIPGIAPSAPTITKVVSNGSTATITLSANSVGTRPILYYIVESNVGGLTISGFSLALTVPGLVAGTNYQFTAKAVSSIGESAASSLSDTVTGFNLQTTVGRYVRFSRLAGSAEYINLVQIDVYDGSNNKITPVTATQSSDLGGYPATNVIDNNSNTFHHTNSSSSEWVQVDLGTEKSISKVVAFHRVGIDSRVLNLVLTLRDNTNTILYTSSPISTISASHEFITLTTRNTQIPAPTISNFEASGNQITISFNEVPNALSYVLTSGNISKSVLTSPITLTGLTNGTTYNIALSAVNGSGIGLPASTTIIAGSPVAIPSAPTITGVSIAGTDATLSFSSVSANPAATSYIISSISGGITRTVTSSPATISGLIAGNNYQFTVKAVNFMGEGSSSSPSDVVTATQYSDTLARYVRFSRPTGVADIIDVGEIEVYNSSNTKITPASASQSTEFEYGSYPASNAIDNNINTFNATSSAANNWLQVDLGTVQAISKVVLYTRVGVESRSAGLILTLRNNSNTIIYTAQPIAGTASSHTINIVQIIPDTPSAPTITSLSYSAGQATVNFTPAADISGYPTLSYTLTISGFTKTAISSPISISGLTNGVTYTVRLTATNINGAGTARTFTFTAGNALIAPLIAPTISGATIGGKIATVSFSTLSLNPSVSHYLISDLCGTIAYEATSSPAIIQNLTPGTNYQFTVKAVNAIGEGPASSPSELLTATNAILTKYVRFTKPSGRIDVGEIEVYDQNNTKITQVTATQSTDYGGYPASNAIDNNVNSFSVTSGGPANEYLQVNLNTSQVVSKVILYPRVGVESYSVGLILTLIDDSNTVTYTGTAITTNASSHTFNITSASAGETPSAPTGLTALPGSGQITVNFTPSADVSGFPTVSYRVTVTPGNITKTSITRPITITGLTNGTAYTIAVSAVNAYSAGAAATINGIKPATVPAAPTLLSVSGGDGVARVAFSAPLNDGGSTITNYMAISTPDSRIGYGLVSPITISGLTDGIPYTFKVAAINPAGTGAYSAASSSITLQTSIPTTATQAVVLSAPTSSTTANTIYIDTFVQASTKAAAEIFVELRAAKKAAIATRTTAQITELTKSIAKSVATKAASSILDVSFAAIVPTLTSTYSGIESKPVAAILPDFSTLTPPVIDLSGLIAQDKHILIEAPENSSFSITDGTVTKSFTLSTLSGEKYMYDNDDVSKKYFVGSVLSFGNFSKRILGFGSVIFGTANVRVTIPITFTLSGVDAEILGQLFTMTGTKINVNNTLSVSGFYDPSGYSWIQYKQGADENDFTAGVKDLSGAVAVKNTILSALNVSGGATYVPARQGTTNMDCSAVFVGQQSKWTNFHNLQDFVLSYFANKVLGHPGALAAISNDSQIRANVTQGFPLALEELKTMQEDKLKSMVQQMMNQDLARFNLDEKDVYCPLKFRAGDKVIMRMILADNTYSLKSPAASPASVVGGVNVAQSASASTAKVNIGSNDSYLLVFTLA